MSMPKLGEGSGRDRAYCRTALGIGASVVALIVVLATLAVVL